MADDASIGEAIRTRLGRLGLSARAFAAAGYVPRASLDRLLGGQTSLRDPRRVADLERGLGWVPGSLNAVRAGNRASEIPIVGWPRADGDWRAAVEESWERYEQARDERLSNVATSFDGDLNVDQVDSQLVRQLGERLCQQTKDWPPWLRARVARTLDAAARDEDATAGDPEVVGVELAGRAVGVRYLPALSYVLAEWARSRRK